MTRYYSYSALAHFVLLGLLLWSPWFHRTPPIYMIDGFDLYGSGGGGGGGKGDGPKKGAPSAEKMGQEVPQPVKKSVPEKPAPVQKEQTSEKPWQVEGKVKKEVPKPVAQKTPTRVVQLGDKDQKAQDNTVRLGKAADQKTGDGGFEWGTGSGGPGKGPGIGVGVGPGGGIGGGSGFGSYLGLVRARIWSEWTQSPVYGTNLSCVVALTVDQDGGIHSIDLEKSSGNSFYDNLARRAVRNASPLPPLPTWFKSTSQRFRIKFVLIE